MLTFTWPGVTINATGLATSALQTTGNTSLASIDGKTPALVTGRVPVDGSGVTQPVSISGTVPVSATALPLPTGASTSANQDTGNTSLASIDTKFTTLNSKDFATSAKQDAEAVLVGAVNETAPASDTASSGLNGRLQRVAQRITSLIALVPSSLGSKAAASSFAVTSSTEDTALMGALTETAPASDTASSGHNGRLQRIAQRLTSLIALLPASLGQKTMANSLAVTLASDQTVIPASQSGTWTVQPGNTQNTTPWLVQDDKSATATLANVAGSASSVTLQALNTSRKGWMIHNDSSAILYVKFGSAASTTSYTVKLIADAYYELPVSSLYTGIITGIWASATGSARVTELT